MSLFGALATVGGTAASWETVAQLAEHGERSAAFNRADAVAHRRGKPLLVVGAPRSRRLIGILPPAHTCGDVCVDLDPIVETQCINGYVADVRELPFSGGYFGAAIASHVLEHMPGLDDFDRAMQELHRVADHVEVVCPHSLSLMAWVTKGHRLWVERQPNGAVLAYDRRTGESSLVVA